MLYNMYCLPLTALIRKYGVSYHVYGDDTPLYVECDKKDSSSAYVTLCACINYIKVWVSFNRNVKKTELFECNSHGLKKISILSLVTYLSIQTCATNLGCVLHVGLVMSRHEARMYKSAYDHLR